MTFKISQSGALITDNFVPHNSCESQLLAECRRLRAANAALVDAVESLLNIEGPAIEGGTFKVFDGLDVRWHFDKARATLAAHGEG